MSTAVIKTPVMELVNLCKVGRSAYLEAIQRRDEMQAAMVRADGLLQAIDAARTEQVAAVLLRMAHPDAGLVEIVGEGSNNETVRVMAMALFCGFTPGKGEFAIFHGRVKSSLYLKDAGIRKLLVQQGCEPPQVSAHFPVQTQLKSGLTVWSVEGEASTIYDGKTYRVQFSGPGSVKLPCKFFKNSSDTSDNIDGIVAKARRRMLLELMRVVQSAAGMVAEDSNEGDETAIEGKVQIIDAGPQAVQAATAETALDIYLRELAADVAKYIRDLHQLLATSQTLKDLEETAVKFREAIDDYKLSERIRSEFRRVYSQRKGELSND